jgi:hypothetical protein
MIVMPPDMREKETTTMKIQYVLANKVINELTTSLRGDEAMKLGKGMLGSSVPPDYVKYIDYVEVRLAEEPAEPICLPISTVNVIEFSDDMPIGLASYPDNKNGNKEAEKRFSAIAKENGKFSDEDLEDGLEDGIVENGTWKVILWHSTASPEREVE